MTARAGQFDSLSGRAAALERWAVTPDRTAATQKARDAFLATLADRADPEHHLTPQARQKAARRLMRARMIRLARARELARKVARNE